MSDAKHDLRKIAFQTVLSLVVMILLFGVVYYFFKDQLEWAGTWMGIHWGLPGVAGTVFCIDFLLVPASADILFPLSLNQDWGNPWILLPVMSFASILAGHLGYMAGHSLSLWKGLHRFTHRFKAQGEEIFLKYGFWAVVLGAVTPVPFSATCWMAGHWKLSYGKFLLATLFRIPRMVLYYLAVYVGIEGLKMLGTQT